MRRKKLLTFFALMLTSVTGAWAQSTNYTLSFDPADTKNISVTVGGTEQTPTEGKIENVAAEAEVKVTPKDGYKFKKLEVKKAGGEATVPSETFDTNVDGQMIYEGTNITITGTTGADMYGLLISEGASVTITAKNGKTITKVEFVCGYGAWFTSGRTVSAGTLNWTDDNENGSIENVNAASVTMSHSTTGSVEIKKFTVYYDDAIDLTNKYWKPGDTFNIGNAWFCNDNTFNETVCHSKGVDAVIPDWTYDAQNNVWKATADYIPIDKYIFNGQTHNYNNPSNISFTPDNGKTADDKPWGFKFKSGTGTQDDPYKFELLYADPNAVEVTTNAAEKGDAFTEATFEMPASDAAVTYELVRDMSYAVTATANDGATRILVKKGEGEKYQPVTALTYVLKDLIDQENPVTLVEGTDYTIVGMHILDGETWKDVEDETDLVPGTYEVIFAGLGKYDGKAYSQELEFFDKSELEETIDEATELYNDIKNNPNYADIATTLKQAIDAAQPVADNENATAKEVDDATEALEEALEVALGDKKVIDDKKAADDVMQYIRNIGIVTYTDESKALIDQARKAYDALTKDQKELVTIYNVLLEAEATYAQLKAEAEIATGINGVKANDGSEWFDLNGRRVTEMPAKKGVYIMNGRKVVVK